MKLQELSVGTELTLEVEWGSNVYEIPTKIVLSMQGRVFIMAFSYNGTTLDLSRVQQQSGMVFHLYWNNAAGERREAWRSINLEMREVKHKVYYEVKTSTFSNESKASERRNQSRLPIQKHGQMLPDSMQMPLDVEVYDISQGGISFRSGKEMTLVGQDMVITFQDEVRGHDFHLRVPCRCVRRVPCEDNTRFHYGCQARLVNRDVLAYISLKTMNLHAEAEAAKRGQPVGEAKHVIDI